MTLWVSVAVEPVISQDFKVDHKLSGIKPLSVSGYKVRSVVTKFVFYVRRIIWNNINQTGVCKFVQWQKWLIQRFNRLVCTTLISVSSAVTHSDVCKWYVNETSVSIEITCKLLKGITLHNSWHLRSVRSTVNYCYAR